MQADKAEKSKSSATAQRADTTTSAATPEELDIYSEVKRLVLDADGNIIGNGASFPEEKRPQALVADMPAANYPPFLGRLGQLGEVSDGNGANAVPSPGSNVRVKIKFDMRE
jgi:hypothetical protein